MMQDSTAFRRWAEYSAADSFQKHKKRDGPKLNKVELPGLPIRGGRDEKFRA